MAFRSGRPVAAVAALMTALVLSACAAGAQKLAGSTPPPGMGGAVLLGSIQQADANPRAGFILLRRYDPATRTFLPEAEDTVARFDLLPAFRFEEILRHGDLSGRTRAVAGDLAALALVPGHWAVEKAVTGYSVANQTYSASSLPNTRAADETIATLAFEVRPGEVAALPLLRVSSNDRWGGGGFASVTTSGEGLDRIVELASARGLTVRTDDWRPVVLFCAPIDYAPLQLRGQADCAPK